MLAQSTRMLELPLLSAATPHYLSRGGGRTIMADKPEKARQTAREATDAADETVGKTTDAARRASETTTRSFEEFSSLGRDKIEDMARASRAMLKSASDLSVLWTSYWNEQVATGMQAMRSLGECHGWDEVLTVQNEFTRTSFDRACARAVKSAEVTVELLTSGLAPLQETTRRASERAQRPMR
jgi:hypothetical protein